MYKMFEISKKKSIFTIWIHYFLYNSNLINWLLDRFALRSIRGVFWYRLRNFTRCEGFVRHFYRVSRVLSQTPPGDYPRGRSLWINRWRLRVSLSNIHPHYLSYLNTIHLSLIMLLMFELHMHVRFFANYLGCLDKCIRSALITCFMDVDCGCFLYIASVLGYRVSMRLILNG